MNKSLLIYLNDVSLFPDFDTHLQHLVLQKLPVPITIKQVRSFKGFVGYYCRVIKGFSKMAATLHALLVGTAEMKKGPGTVQRTLDCQTAFDTLKMTLVIAPILPYADFDAEGPGPKHRLATFTGCHPQK